MEKIWNFSLFVMEKQPVTFGNAIIALCVALIVGQTTKFLRLRLRNYLSRSTTISGEGILLIDKLLFLINLLITSILVLKILHIPVTDFTVVGSAVALAFGFAAKKILNNTISGFVVLLERAIQVGDVIELEDQIGTVKSIGIRSTIIHTPENVDIILPNSNIL